MSDSSKKKRELSPAQENKEALKKSKESDDLDTPTKLMIDKFFESQISIIEEASSGSDAELQYLIDDLGKTFDVILDEEELKECFSNTFNDSCPTELNHE